MKDSKNGVAVIKFNPNDEIGTAIQNRGYDVFRFYRGDQNYYTRCLRRVWLKYNLPFKSIWFNKEILKNKAKRILIFESLLDESYVNWLCRNKKNADIAVWYWNVVFHTINPDRIKKYSVKLWSFSRTDCKKYGMKFNPAPYFHEMVYEDVNVTTDVSFVGRNKGRLDAVMKWKKVFEEYGLSTEFYITPDNRYDKNPLYSPVMTYRESMTVSARSKILFDYIEVDNSGQSMRVMEALFLKKKLVTNSKLIKDYDFYCPENIFVIGVDSMDLFPAFINAPYKNISEDIVNQYDFSSFIRRFWHEDKNWWSEINEKDNVD